MGDSQIHSTPKEISLEEIDKVVIDKIYKEIEEAKELKEKKTALLAAHGLSYHHKKFYLNHLKKEGVIVDYIHRYNNSATVIFEA